ncbi:YceD family protein [Cnuibacter sp. UC19_7]|uniref:YceD family protein n=1 Tax=Cnuibacter sp. UC19_7 TaxID=3350166 RepID=UPI003671525E
MLNVRDLERRPGEMREKDLDVTLDARMGEGLLSVQEGSTLHIDARLESVHEGILVTGEVTGVAEGECGRCLRDITEPVEVEFQELFAYPSEEAFDYVVEADHVDLEPLVRDAVVLSLPFQPVCSPDCPGLDPATGERLQENAEGASSSNADPRWAALAGLAASADPDDEKH